jgi:hypothetical protein
MEKTLNEISYAINQDSLFVDTHNQLQPFHIYFELKNFYKDKVSSSDSLKMYVHHLKLERCISLLRQRNTAGALSMLAEVEKLDRNFPDLVQKGMDSLYMAMLSYRDYIIHHHIDEAITKLNRSIQYGIIQSQDYPYFALTIPTQWINVLRVLIREKHEQIVIEETVKLLKLTLFGIHEQQTFGETYRNLDQAAHNLVIHDVFDNMIFNIESRFGYETLNDYLRKIIDKTLMETTDYHSFHPEIVTVLSLLKQVNDQQTEAFIYQLHEQKGKLIDIPSSLKRLIINYFQQIKETKNHEIATRYYTEETIFA